MGKMNVFWLWRYALLLLAMVNITLLLIVLNFGSWDGAYPRMMKLLGVPYVFQTSWRCFLPSEYVYRKTATDFAINSVLVARLLAAVGEFCYGLQIALALYML